MVSRISGTSAGFSRRNLRGSNRVLLPAATPKPFQSLSGIHARPAGNLSKVGRAHFRESYCPADSQDDSNFGKVYRIFAPMNLIARFMLIYFGFLLVTGAAFWFYNQNADPQYTHPHGWVSFGVFAGVTGLVHMFLLRAAQKDPKAFVRGFMAANTIKIFIYLAFLIVFVLFMKTGAVVFIAEFAVFYLVFTVFEVSLLYKHLRPKQ